MRIIICFIAILFTATLSAQKKTQEPLILKGQISDCPEKMFLLFTRDDDYSIHFDTIKLDENGRFYLKSFRVQRPQIAHILKNTLQIRDLYIAPGYDLTITANGRDGKSIIETKKITGKGALSNGYHFVLDSILASKAKTRKWYELNETEFLDYLKNDKHLKDSLWHEVFKKVRSDDKYYSFFSEKVRLDNEFYKLTMLVNFLTWNDYNKDSSISFLKNNFDNNILNHLYEDSFLISDGYANLLIESTWPTFLVNLDLKSDSTIGQQQDYKFRKINSTYKGKVRELALYYYMQNLVLGINSVASLTERRMQIDYGKKFLKNEKQRNYIDSILLNRSEELSKTLIGKPAPLFTLKSDTGTVYRLGDFKGKVIYVDLWASWCSPCREETLPMKELYDKFKKDNRIAFISIAIRDGKNEWKKALDKDKPTWLQLFDEDDMVGRSYVVTSIPKFILIDKQGNIVSLDSARPSSGKEIEEILSHEIAK